MSTVVDAGRVTLGICYDSFMCIFSVMQNSDFQERFPTLRIDVKEWPLLVRGSPNLPCSDLVRVTAGRAPKQKELLKKFIILGLGRCNDM